MSDNVVDERSELDQWLSYKKTRDPKIREAFIKQYAPLVRYVAGKVAMGLPQNVDYDDLVGFGVFGLIDAIDKFDPAKHVKFKTYAVTRIRGAIFDELRAIDWVPRSVRQKSREVEEAINKGLPQTAIKELEPLIESHFFNAAANHFGYNTARTGAIAGVFARLSALT